MEIKIHDKVMGKNIPYINVDRHSKQAIEPWNEDKADISSFTYDRPELVKHLKGGNPYAILCGYDNLFVLDIDDMDYYDEINELIGNIETLEIETPGGGRHKYFRNPNPTKIILEDGDKHIGEWQGRGQYVIGPGSFNYKKNKGYKVVNDKPIANISEEVVNKIRKKYGIKETGVEWNKYKSTPIGSQLDFKKLIPALKKFKKSTGGELYGSHPIHGSKGGMNFFVNVEKGLWHCFREDSGGDALDWLSISEGVCECKDFRKGGKRLRGKDFQKIKAIAKVKWGINTDEDNKYQTETFSFGPKGLSIDFLKLAEMFRQERPFFYDKQKLWWFWDANNYRWEIVDEIDVMNNIDRELEWGGTINSTYKNNILEALKRTGRKHMPKEPKQTWIQFQDTVVDIKTGEKFKPTHKYFMTNPIPWRMGDSDKTPIIDKIFTEWMVGESQDESYVTTLKEIAAYCILTYMPIHRIFCLIGGGLNGKGSYLRFIEKFIGQPNITASSIERLTTGRFETAKLYKKLVVTIGEIDKTVFSKTALIKSLAGDDLMAMEIKGKDSFDTHNYAKPIIAANTLPETTDKTFGFFRRWSIVDFPNRFNERQDILKAIPNEEYENFCNQCATLLSNVLERGKFLNDGSIENRAERYKERSSPVNQFIRDECIKNNSYVEFSEFFSELTTYLEENGHKALSPQAVSKLLKHHGKTTTKKNIYDANGGHTTQVVIEGLSLKSQTQRKL